MKLSGYRKLLAFLALAACATVLAALGVIDGLLWAATVGGAYGAYAGANVGEHLARAKAPLPPLPTEADVRRRLAAAAAVPRRPHPRPAAEVEPFDEPVPVEDLGAPDTPAPADAVQRALEAGVTIAELRDAVRRRRGAR